jgi:hypothetical protein
VFGELMKGGEAVTDRSTNSLPLTWHLALVILLAVGLVLASAPLPVPPPLAKLTSRIRPDAFWKALGVLLIAAVISHWAVFVVLRWVRTLFELGDPTDTARRELWPPAVLGLCEATMYPVALVSNHSDFIGLWLLLKVAGQWPGWGLREKDNAEKLDQGRRRYYHFLIGNAFMVGAGLITYGVLKMLAM